MEPARPQGCYALRGILENCADKHPQWLVDAASRGARRRLYQASSGDVYAESLAADAVLRVVADFCRKRGTPSFDGGFQSFDGPKGSNNEWSEAAKAITMTRRCCRGVALLSIVGGLDGRVVLDAIKDASAESEEARAAQVAAKASSVALTGHVCTEFGALNDLLDDEDADVLDDLEIFFGDDDQAENEVVVRGARLVAETTSGAAAVAASAAARLELFESALAKGNHERALQHAFSCRLWRAAWFYTCVVRTGSITEDRAATARGSQGRAVN